MTASFRAVLAALLILAASGQARAHETRPGLLELRESGPGTYGLLWKKPSGGEIEIYIAPILPRECRLVDSG
jgi:hypothetical protein